MTFWTVVILIAVALFVYLLERGTFDRIVTGGEITAPRATVTSRPAAAPPSAPATGAAPIATPAPMDPAPASATHVKTDVLEGFADGAVQVYFTHPRYPDTSAGRSGGLDTTVSVEIDHARQTIDLASFDFDLRSVTDALLRARGRGVKIRMVVDGENLAAVGVAQQTGRLQKAGIPITFDRRPAFMHDKFVVLDHAVVWTGSWNLTINDTFRNNNNMLRLADAQIADNYTRKFELLFASKGGPGHPVHVSQSVFELGGYRIKTAFAPDNDITGDVVQAIDDARQSIDILAFTFSSDPIADALVAARKRGVKIRVVIERRNANGSGSEYKRFKTSKIDVRQDGNCYIMHDKVIIIDAHEVITGSFNWTRQAQEQNDENALFIDNTWLAQRYAEEFTRIYAQASKPATCG